jgi:hypothetical protein
MAGGTLRTAAGSLSRSWLVLAGAARHSCFAHYGSQWPIRRVGVAVGDGHNARCHGLSVVQRGVERPATAHAGQNSSLQWCNLLAVSIAGCLVRHDCRRFAVILETHPVLWSCRQFVLYPGAVGLSEQKVPTVEPRSLLHSHEPTSGHLPHLPTSHAFPQIDARAAVGQARVKLTL